MNWQDDILTGFKLKDRAFCFRGVLKVTEPPKERRYLVTRSQNGPIRWAQIYEKLSDWREYDGNTETGSYEARLIQRVWAKGSGNQSGLHLFFEIDDEKRWFFVRFRYAKLYNFFKSIEENSMLLLNVSKEKVSAITHVELINES